MHQYSAYPTIKDINIITNLFILDSLCKVCHISIFIFKVTIVTLKAYFTATLMALSPNFAMTMVSDTAQDAVPSTAEEEPMSLPSAA